MIDKAIRQGWNTDLFQDGDKASLRREVASSILGGNSISYDAMLVLDKEVKEAKAELKS